MVELLCVLGFYNSKGFLGVEPGRPLLNTSMFPTLVFLDADNYLR